MYYIGTLWSRKENTKHAYMYLHCGAGKKILNMLTCMVIFMAVRIYDIYVGFISHVVSY